MIRIRNLLLFAGSFLALGFLCKLPTQGFDDDNLLAPAPAGSQWDISAESPPENLDAILSQPFHFLAKGHQAFAFVSEDGKHVLKLFKPRHTHIERPKCLFNYSELPFTKMLYRLWVGAEFQQRIDRDFQSYVNAYRSFKEDSRLEYVHLAETSNLHKKIIIHDPLHSPREFDADATCFLVQQRVDPFFPSIEKWIREGKMEEAQIALSQMVDLLARRMELGFVKSSNKFDLNFGFVGSRPIQLDIGRLSTAQDLGLPKEESIPYASLHQTTLRLKHWLNQHSPALSSYFNQCIDDLIVSKTQKTEELQETEAQETISEQPL